MSAPSDSSPSEVQEPEESLVQRTLGGDLAAFDELVRRYQNYVANLLFSFCPHQSDLEDLTQEVMIRAYHGLHSWRPKAKYSSWIRRIAVNVGIDYFRKEKRNPVADARVISLESHDVRASDTHAPSHSHSEIVQTILSHLAPDDRTLLTLQYLQDLPLSEVADVLGWSLSKVKVRSMRAKQRLRQVLTYYGIEEL